MEILHVYKDYHPVLGGIENHIRVLAEAQAAAGHGVTVLVCDPGGRTRREELGGVRVIKAGRLATLLSMPLSLAQPLALRRLRPDVAHLHSPYPLGEASHWLLGRARATVITYHSDVVRQQPFMHVYGPLFRRVLRRADRIIVTSARYAETSPWLAPLGGRCAVVPLGVDTARFTPPASPYAGPPMLLFAGRLRYYKGLDTLLRAMTRLPEARLTVAGDGPMRAAWQALAGGLGVAPRVTFLGDVGDEALADLYRRAHAFVLPANARAEAFGTVLLEAMACGLPCVTTEVGTGTSWVVREGETGRVVPPGDPDALARALGGLLEDPALGRRMGRAGRARVEALFTVEKMIAGVEDVYRQVLRAKGVEV